METAFGPPMENTNQLFMDRFSRALGLTIIPKLFLFKLQKNELSDCKFADIENALSLLTPSLAKRVEKSLEAIEKNNSIYMENNEH